ncbi:MAG: sulfurtransferase [Phycisphaerales bacterium]|nr:sulfurtransferase [Phycisphaerales bacterium]
MAEYAHPEVLVDTRWVRDHLNDPKVRLVEVDVDTKSYDAGHIPGAVGFNWQTQLQDQVRRDIISQQDLETLLSAAGIKPADTIVLYGDNSNWFACYAFWILKYYGHADVRLLNGGRLKWLNESDKPMTTEKPSPVPSNYKINGTHPELRAKLPDVLKIVEDHGQNLIDVRSTDEYTGKIIAPPGMSETAQRPGHVPTARSIPWSLAANTTDGTFKSSDELRAVYFEKGGVDAAKPTVAYCRIGERSSHTWFVLTYLLGQNNVRNYDGSWTEYGSVVGVPIER